MSFLGAGLIQEPIVELLNHGVIVRLSPGQRSIKVVDAFQSFLNPIFRCSWLSAAIDAASRTSHNFHEVEVSVTIPHLLNKLFGIAAEKQNRSKQ